MPWSSPRKLVAAAASIPLVTLGLLAATGSPAVAADNPGPGFPAHYAAPYVETWNCRVGPDDAANATGNKYYTLAFIISQGTCNASINGDTAITDSGWNSAINSAAGRRRRRDRVLRRRVRHRARRRVYVRLRRCRRVQGGHRPVQPDPHRPRHRGRSAGQHGRQRPPQPGAGQPAGRSTPRSGKTLAVDYTLPVDPTGSGLSDSLSLLNNAKSHNLNVNLVNIMTMDYGSADGHGRRPRFRRRTRCTASSARSGPPRRSAQLWAMEGNTPMIGVNDTTTEVFTTGNASTLESFAASNGIQELSFWSLGRDNQGSSGTSQSNYQFTNIFKAITGGGSRRRPRRRPAGQRTPIHGYGGKCVDVAGGEHRQRHRDPALHLQRHQRAESGRTAATRLQALGKCMDVTVGRYRERHEGPALRLQRHRRAAVDGRRERQPGQHRLRQVPGRDRAQLGRRDATADLDLRRQCEPELDAPELT